MKITIGRISRGLEKRINAKNRKYRAKKTKIIADNTNVVRFVDIVTISEAHVVSNYRGLQIKSRVYYGKGKRYKRLTVANVKIKRIYKDDEIPTWASEELIEMFNKYKEKGAAKK